MTHKMIMKIALSISAVALIIALAFTGCGGSSSSSGSSAPTDARGISDTAFGTLGVVTTTIDSSSIINKIALQSDGKIVAVGTANSGGSYNFTLARYNTNGSLDTTFDTDGVITTVIGSGQAFCNDIAIQSNGMIVAAGSANLGGFDRFALARYTTTGALDSTFGTAGITSTLIGSDYSIGRALILQTDGKIVVGGESRTSAESSFALARYNTDGTLDTSFGANGVITNAIGAWAEIRDIAIQPDGKIIAAGAAGFGTNFFTLARYTSAGALDTTFDTDGVVTTTIGAADDYIFDMMLQPDGKILAGGYSYDGVSNYYTALARYNANGAIDTTFGGGDGVITMTIPTYTDIEIYGIALQSNGKIVVACYAQSSTTIFMVARYNVDGTLDTTFGGGDGIVLEPLGTNGTAQAIAIQSNGYIVLGGYANYSSAQFTLVRYK